MLGLYVNSMNGLYVNSMNGLTFYEKFRASARHQHGKVRVSDVARNLSQSRQMNEFQCFSPKISNFCSIWIQF